MPNQFSSGKFAIAECDRCGQRFKLKELKKLTIKTKLTNIKVCPECWEQDQPQLQLGMYPVDDPQAVREPRPDTSYYELGNDGAGGSRVIQWGWNPVGGASQNDAGLTPNYLTSLGAVGTVMIDVAAWSATTSYSVGDAASYSGGYYLVAKANINHVPTDITYWSVN